MLARRLWSLQPLNVDKMHKRRLPSCTNCFPGVAVLLVVTVLGSILLSAEAERHSIEQLLNKLHQGNILKGRQAQAKKGDSGLRQRPPLVANPATVTFTTRRLQQAPPTQQPPPTAIPLAPPPASPEPPDTTAYTPGTSTGIPAGLDVADKGSGGGMSFGPGGIVAAVLGTLFAIACLVVIAIILVRRKRALTVRSYHGDLHPATNTVASVTTASTGYRVRSSSIESAESMMAGGDPDCGVQIRLVKWQPKSADGALQSYSSVDLNNHNRQPSVSSPIASPASSTRPLFSKIWLRSEHEGPLAANLPPAMKASPHHLEIVVAGSGSLDDPLSPGLQKISIARTIFNVSLRSVSNTLATSQEIYYSSADTLARALKLNAEDPFVTNTATNYSWSLDSLSGLRALEAGVVPHPNAVDPLPARLTCQEVQEQLHLMAAGGLIYTGPHSVVARCRWPGRFGPDTLLAAKCVREPLGIDGQDLVAVYTKEVEALTKCRHPHVVRLYGYCLEPPTVCIIMELLPMTLHDRLYKTPAAAPGPASNSNVQPASGLRLLTRSITKQLSSLTPRAPKKQPASTMTPGDWTQSQFITIATDVASALQHVHTRLDQKARRRSLSVVTEDQEMTSLSIDEGGLADEVVNIAPAPAARACLVHQDLQPANILLTSSSRAKLTGFGAAAKRLLEVQDTANYVYKAPESLASMGKLPQTVDVYSLGMVLWEMAGRCRPWQGADAASVKTKVLKGDRPPLPGDTPGSNIVLAEEEDKQPTTDNSGIVNDGVAAAAGDGVPSMTVPVLLTDMPQVASLIRQCWSAVPKRRPSAAHIVKTLLTIQAKQAKEQ